MKAVKTITFHPCSGFGTQGRSASLEGPNGEYLGTGYGATDDEAVLEALVNAGMDSDVAFDSVGATIKGATIYRNQPEFPNGEFPV